MTVERREEKRREEKRREEKVGKPLLTGSALDGDKFRDICDMETIPPETDVLTVPQCPDNQIFDVLFMCTDKLILRGATREQHANR